MHWRLVARMAWRDWRAGELTLLLVALVVAVAAVTSVGFLADRLGGALERDGAQALGADQIVVSETPFEPAWLARAQDDGLSVTETVVFPSMAVREGETPLAQLVSAKAVAPGYPLRGTLRLSALGDRVAEPGTDFAADGIPAPGTAWVETAVLTALDAQLGDTVQLGDATLRLDGLIALEPDRGLNFVNLSPRLMFRTDAVAETGLVVEGSRVTYRLLLAGTPQALGTYRSWLDPQLGRGQRVETLAGSRPELRQNLDRAQRFLSLVTLLAVLIAAAAVALAARRYRLRHIGAMAVMRCLGATRRELTQLLMGEFLLLAVIGAALGGLVGYGAHLLLELALGDLLGTRLPAARLWPVLPGMATGVTMLLVFAAPALAALRRTPPAQVLRQEGGGLPADGWRGYLLGLVVFTGVLIWTAGDTRLGAMVAGGFALAFALFAGVAALVLALLQRVRQRLGGSVALRFALAGLVRRRAATIAQLCALSIGLMALLLLGLTRTDLVDGWQQAAPADAPNRFLINIQPDQRAPVTEALTAAGVSAELVPMVRGRLLAINDQPVAEREFADRRARRQVDREGNLSYAERIPPHNRLVAGRELQADQMELSLDDGVAQSLGVGLGDRLTYEVAGEPITVTITSLREPEWGSMAVNFFAVMTPLALAAHDQSSITSFHVAPGQPDPLPALVARYPNLSVFDVTAIVAQLQRVLEQITLAVQGVFLFTVLAGILVLYAALSATRDERVREAALLRAMGATRQQLARAQWLELGLLGTLAGLMAALAASLLAWALARYAFEVPLQPGAWVWGAGVLGGWFAAWLGGLAGLRGVLRTPPWASLRVAAAT